MPEVAELSRPPQGSKGTNQRVSLTHNNQSRSNNSIKHNHAALYSAIPNGIRSKGRREKVTQVSFMPDNITVSGAIVQGGSK